MSTPKKLIYVFLISIFLSGFCITYANNENPDEEEKEKQDEEEECPNNNSDDNGSISVKRPFGKIPWEDKPGGRFNIMRVKPSPILVTPEALRYNFWGDLSIFSIDYAVDDYGKLFMRVVIINHLEKMFLYDFYQGESTAVPKGSSRSSQRRLVLEDEDGTPVSFTPNQDMDAYVNNLTEYYGDGSCRVFDYTTRDLIRYCDENGRIIDLSNPDYGVEVIRDGNSMRQVKAPEGLADVVTLSDESYIINYYTYENIGNKGANGYYQPTGMPYKTFKLENTDPEPDSYNHIRITETYGNKSWIIEYRYSDAFEQWDMIKGDGLRKETKYLASSDGDTEIFIRELRDQNDTIVSKTRKTVKNFSWDDYAKRLVEVVQDPDGIALTKTIDYYDNPDEVGRYGNRRQTVNADGSWIRYDYDDQGRKTREITPWLDSPSDAPENEAKVTEYVYTPVDINDVPLPFDTRPRTITEKTLGIVTAKTFHAYLINADGEKVEIVEQATAQDSVYGDPGNLKTVRTWYASTAPSEKSGRLKSVVHPNGKVESYDYTLDSDVGQFTEMMTVQAILNDAVTDIAYESTRTTKTWDFQGNLIEEAFFIYSGAAYELVTTTIHVYDDRQHLLESIKDGRTLMNQVWENGELVSVTDESGTETRFSYDALKRMDSEIKVGHGTRPDVITLYTRDLGEIDCGCDGKMTKTILAGDLSLETQREKDPVGRVSLEIDASGYSTRYDYANSGRTVTRVNPNTSTVITDHYLDGQLKSMTGDGAIHEYHSYGVNADGTAWAQTTVASETSPRYRKTTTDMLGRIIREEQPAFENGTFTTDYRYNDRGLLEQQTQTGLAATLFEYDAFGDLVRSALDVDVSGTIEPASSDRITDQETVYTKDDSGNWFEISTTKVYPDPNSADTVQISESKRRLNGFTLTSPHGALATENISIDVHGNETRSLRYIDRANKKVTEQADTPSSSIDSTRVIVNGLLLSQNPDTVAVATTFTYDALERLVSVKEPRHTDASSTEYYTNSNQVFTRTDAAGNTMAYTYYGDGEPGAGQVASITDPLSQKAYYAYDLLGRQTHIWGQKDYPQAYSYNAYGELSALTTYRDPSETNYFAGATWPNPIGGDVTIWNYDAATGLLIRKEYADGKGTDYAYDAANRLKKRTWARDGGLDTNYGYSPLTGELLTIDYEAAETADITYTYDRLGRQATVTDATGTRSFAYDGALLQLVSEQLDSAFYDGMKLNRLYEDGSELNGTAGRTAGYRLDTNIIPPQTASPYGPLQTLLCEFLQNLNTYSGGNSRLLNALLESFCPPIDPPEPIIFASSYAYDTTGRLTTISDGSDVFTYGYVSDSNLLALVTSPMHSASYTYEANRDLMTLINNQVSGASVSKYEYGYDGLGRRTDRSQSGSAINQVSTDTFNYNERSEVISATNSVETTTEWNPTYSYDTIGNRKSSTGIFEANYTTNALNQYDTFTPHSSPLTTLNYDADGNLLSNGRWTYTWNNENRLTSATDGTKTLTFTYDYQGRLVKKEDGTNIEVYVYDGWNRIVTFETSPSTSSGQTFALKSTNVWGLDLSGSLRGAGGVGGLLKESEYNSNFTLRKAYYSLYDVNGNITQKLDREGEVAMSVAYDPFGNIIEGKLVGDYGFSTKPLVDALDWYYYGFRYYDPVMGRWPNRDPIGELGHRLTTQPSWITFAKSQIGLMLSSTEAKIINAVNKARNTNYSNLQDALPDWIKISAAIIEYSELAKVWNYLDYRAYYRGALGSSYSSNSYFDDLAANSYQFAFNDAVDFIDLLGLKVEIKSRDVKRTRGAGTHTWVEVTDSSGNRTSGSGTNEDGKLGVKENHSADYNPTKDNPVTSTEEVSPPPGMTQEEWDQAVKDSIKEQCKKDEKRDYKLFGGDGGCKSGNCHVVTSDIIEGAGGTIPSNYNPPGLNPGLRN